MVISINEYFDTWVENGGPFRRLAMGHTLGSMVLLLAVLGVAGVISVWLSGTMVNAVVLFYLPFLSMLANRTSRLRAFIQEEERGTKSPALAKCEPMLFALHLRGYFITDGLLTSCWCQLSLLLVCLPLMLMAILLEGRVSLVLELILFCLLAGLIASLWSVGGQFSGKNRALSMVLISLLSFYGPVYILEIKDVDEIANGSSALFSLSLYSVPFTIISTLTSALMVAIVLAYRLYSITVPGVVPEIVPRCTFLAGCIAASILGPDFLHPVAIGALGIIALDVFTAHTSNQLKFVPSLFRSRRYGWISRLFFFPGWPSLTLFTILVLTLVIPLQLYCLNDPIAALALTLSLLLFMVVPIILFSQISELWTRPLYILPPALLVIYLLCDLISGGLWEPYDEVCIPGLALVFCGSIVYGVYSYFRDWSKVSDIRIIADPYRAVWYRRRKSETDESRFLKSHLEKGPLFLWHCANSSVGRFVKFIVLFCCIVIMLVLWYQGSHHDADIEKMVLQILIPLGFTAVPVGLMFKALFLDDTQVKLISGYRVRYLKDKKLAMLVLPLVITLALLPGVLLFPENIVSFGQWGLVIFLIPVVFVMASDYEMEPQFVRRLIVVGQVLLLISYPVLSSATWYPQINYPHLWTIHTLNDRISALGILIYLVLWYYQRRSGSTKELFYLRSSALLAAVLAVYFSGELSWVVIYMALIPLIDTILFDLMQTPRMLPSLYRGSQLSTVCAVAINPGWPGAFFFGQISLIVLSLGSFCCHGTAGGLLVYYLALGFGCIISPIALAVATGRVVDSENFFSGIAVVAVVGVIASAWAGGKAGLEPTAIGVSLLSWVLANYGLYRHMQLVTVKRDCYCPGPESEYPWGR